MAEIDHAGVERLIIEPIEELEGFRGKVWPAEALQNAEPPFAFYTIAREESEEDLQGETELCTTVFRLHLVSKRLAALGLYADRAKAKLKALRGTVTAGRYVERVRLALVSPDLYEAEVGLFRRVYEVTVFWQPEA